MPEVPSPEIGRTRKCGMRWLNLQISNICQKKQGAWCFVNRRMPLFIFALWMNRSLLSLAGRSLSSISLLAATDVLWARKISSWQWWWFSQLIGFRLDQLSISWKPGTSWRWRISISNSYHSAGVTQYASTTKRIRRDTFIDLSFQRELAINHTFNFMKNIIRCRCLHSKKPLESYHCYRRLMVSSLLQQRESYKWYVMRTRE